MANLTNEQESVVLNRQCGGTAPPALTGPMRVQLLSALGTGDAAGTPIAGAIQPFGATTSTGGSAVSNSALIRYTGLANPTTVAGFRIIDSAATPVVTLDNLPRTGGAVTVTDGIIEIAANALSVTAD